MTFRFVQIALFIFLLNFPFSTVGAMEYKGEHLRKIKSLSLKDIQQLESGKGWGFAKAAELNGIPGPSHLIEFSKQIGLSSSQLVKIEALFEKMKSGAIPLGKKLVFLEGKLDAAFADKSIDSKHLKALLEEIGGIRSQLRFVHLVTHLSTPEILTKHQIMIYNQLRGYDNESTEGKKMHH